MVRKVKKKEKRELQGPCKVLYSRVQNHNVTALDVVVAAMTDMKVFIIFMAKMQFDSPLIDKYLHKFDNSQKDVIRNRLSPYAFETLAKDSVVAAALPAYEFLEKGFGVESDNIYDYVEVKEGSAVNERLNDARKLIIHKIKAGKIENILDRLDAEKVEFLFPEHQNLLNELHILAVTIEMNWNFAKKDLTEQQKWSFEGMIYEVRNFIYNTMIDYIVHTDKEFKKDIIRIKKEFAELRAYIEDSERTKQMAKAAKKAMQKKKKVKVKQIFLIEGITVSKRKYEKEKQFYIDNEDYIVTNNTIVRREMQ